MLTIREYVKGEAAQKAKPDSQIGMKHFDEALSKVRAIGKSRLKDYDEWAKQFEDGFR